MRAAPASPSDSSSASPQDSEADFSLANHFLIAMPNMSDPRFSGTVIYVCEHTPRGALGLVINRPTELTLETLFERVEMKRPDDAGEDAQSLEEPGAASPAKVSSPLPASLVNKPVYAGGPVQTDRGFVLHDQSEADYSSTLTVDGGLTLTTSRDVLEALASGDGPNRLLVTLGYTGWDGGQLEDELGRNAWLTVQADPSIIFDVPHGERFNAAISLLGFNPAMLSGDAGHA